MAELKSPVVRGMQEQEGNYHNGNPEHYEIPALRRPGHVLMRLEFTEEERIMIDTGDDLYVEIMTEGGIQPMRFIVGESEEYWRSIGYGRTIPDSLEIGNRHVGLEAVARLLSENYPDLWQDVVIRYNLVKVHPSLHDKEVELIIKEVEEWKRSNS